MSDLESGRQPHVESFDPCNSWPVETTESLKAILLVAGNPDFASVRRRIMNIARDEGLAYLIPASWNPDGTLKP
jgi:hypothetical protein